MPEVVNERIEPRDIEEEMRSSYIDYAMSVIVGRALPDVRDGLKPVHRRILYGMFDMGMTPGRPYKKCARIVGEVLGKYHPHGDTAVYDALVRMAQDFSVRYQLIDGHGNFGSVDGDSPAAMRYTEARLAKVAMELLRDIEKETVNFVPNFDESLKEPAVLPARIPNLLVNGSSGIAVGMATNIPPHNLGEVIDGTVAYIDNPEITPKELNKHIKGPDFPTGATIMGRTGIKNAYETGRGSIRVRGKTHVEEMKGGKNRIIITELPYQVNKARLAEKIAELVRDKHITEIADLRDESDRSGMRLVVELKREAVPQVALNKLYKHTQLQDNFGVIMLALVDGVPRVMNLAQVIGHYVNHQKDVVIRRTKFELDKAEKRAHILEGLLIALDNIDEVIKIIRGSKTVDEAKSGLMSKFKLSDVQAQAILDMRLQKLTGLERQKVADEFAELQKTIKYLKSLLASEEKIMEVIKTELLEIKEKYADKRRSEITAAAEDIDIEDLIADEEMVVTLTHSGYIKRLPLATYRMQKRGGRGVAGLNLKDGDFVEHLFVASTLDNVLFFSNRGKVYRLKVYEIPVGSRQARGQNVINLLPFQAGEKIAALLSIKDFDQAPYLIMGTKNGLVKKTALAEYNTSRKDGILAIGMRPGDELIAVKLTDESSEIILASQTGQAIRFKQSDVRPMGRTAMGVKGINLKPKDLVLGMDVVMAGTQLFVITEKGYGKRTPTDKYPLQKRGGQGVKTIKLTDGKGLLSAVRLVDDSQELMIISEEGVVIRVNVKDVSIQGRSTQGVRVMNLKGKDKVSTLARIITSNKEDEAE
ncbi:MAG: DNA gyrase subunit A [Actinobacteria bacterium]|nr:MAG: DNA gyrase subunit A [Actinomycetota bacterium]